MPDDKSFFISAESMDRYFKEVAKEYRKAVGKEQPAEIILVGGASILLNYYFRKTTNDMDAIILAASSMKDAINRVADRCGLPDGWLNDDFIRTSSYSPKLVEHSRYYKTFSNVLTVRTVSAEYLLAMKLRSARKYKHDLSDIVGILAEQEMSGHPISKDMIAEAYQELFGEDMSATLPEDMQELLEKLFQEKNLFESYQEIGALEMSSCTLLETYDAEHPKVLHEDNIEEVLKRLHHMNENTKA